MYARILSVVALSGLLAGSADGAILFLRNAEDGSGSMDLGPGETGSLNVLLEIGGLDSDFAYATVYLNDGDEQGDGQLEVVDVIAGLDEPEGEVIYDRSSFALPTDISHDLHNEYVLDLARTDGDGWGPGIYVLDTLVILNGSDEQGEHPITFEEGDRLPQVFTSDFEWFPWNLGVDFIPDFLNPGVGGEDNPFIINTIPEPATALLLALGAVALLRRRRTEKT